MARLLVNPISRVWFNGWETDTAQLGQNGWHVSVEEDLSRRRFEMLLYHPQSDIKMLATSKTDPLRERASRGYETYHPEKFGNFFDGPQFTVVQAWAGRAVLRVMDAFPMFDTWSETRPTTLEARDQDIMDMPIFQKINAPKAEELIVEPQDVMQLLDQIKRMQAPAQAAIRQRDRGRERVPLACATILTFPEAA